MLSLTVFAAILLGDARQSVVDVFMAGAAIAGSFALWKTGRFRALPRATMFLWAGVFIVGFPLFWPDVLGAAIQSYVRYLFGFMVFSLLYAVSTKQTEDIIESVLLVVGASASVFAIIFLFVDRPVWLPPMNLLYPSYGHNHAADILLFVFPTLMYHRGLPRPLRVFFWVTILCGFVFSFARGAWLLVALYAVGTFVASRGINRKIGALTACVFLAAFLVISGTTTGQFAPKTSDPAVVPQALVRFTNKGGVGSDPRLEYWRQAITMLRERPIFGSGPGSFYYGSRRLQSHPGAFSWFAHSFPLQTLAEQGVLGALPVLLLFGWVVWRLTRFVASHPPEQNALARLSIGALLTVAYSFIEFNLSFAVVWAVFWVIAGMVLGAEYSHKQRENRSRQLLLPTIALTVFYLLFIGQSIVFSFFPKHTSVAFYLTPFDTATAQYYLSSEAITPQGIRTAVAFHKTDIETQQVVAEAWQRSGQLEAALDTRRRIIWLDPFMDDSHKEYLGLLVRLGRYEEVTHWFMRYPRLFFPANIDKELASFPLSPVFVRERASEIPKLFDPKHSHEVRYSRFYYTVGLWYLPTQPDRTRRLWELASLLQPKLSYLWVERAALEEQVFNNHKAAMTILADCLDDLSAREHCSRALSLPQLTPPGHYRQEIDEK